MRKYILSSFLIVAILSLGISVNAAPALRESVPCDATEESIQIVENLVGGVFDEVLNGLGYADAKNKSNAIIFNAVISHQTNGYGYGILTSISNNTIYQYRDMILRPRYYEELEEKMKIQLEDILSSYANGNIDYKTAEKEAYTRIYQSINPAFDYDYQMSLDTCYRDIPSVDYAVLTTARRRIMNAK